MRANLMRSSRSFQLRNISYVREVSCPPVFCEMFLEVAIGSVEHSERGHVPHLEGASTFLKLTHMGDGRSFRISEREDSTSRDFRVWLTRL
jgi:hypothetical protein